MIENLDADTRFHAFLEFGRKSSRREWSDSKKDTLFAIPEARLNELCSKTFKRLPKQMPESPYLDKRPKPKVSLHLDEQQSKAKTPRKFSMHASTARTMLSTKRKRPL
jgi:hypothetical protein